MNRNDLIQIFDIETFRDFIDFEHFSTLIEDVENIDEDMFFETVDGVATLVFMGLIDYYFEDIRQGVPDECADIDSMLSSVSLNFRNRVKQIENHTEKMQFADELYRFRLWYMQEGQVGCKDLATGDEDKISVCEALTRCRMQKLNEGKFEYDFSRCEPFVTEEYWDDEDEDGEEDNEDEYE